MNATPASASAASASATPAPIPVPYPTMTPEQGPSTRSRTLIMMLQSLLATGTLPMPMPMSTSISMSTVPVPPPALQLAAQLAPLLVQARRQEPQQCSAHLIHLNINIFFSTVPFVCWGNVTLYYPFRDKLASIANNLAQYTRGLQKIKDARPVASRSERQEAKYLLNKMNSTLFFEAFQREEERLRLHEVAPVEAMDRATVTRESSTRDPTSTYSSRRMRPGPQ
ncbi:hypothetical protein BG004_008114 [Podila humilis]|nr:hypothetical protein BG004_008114 [Podila humilis]